MSSSPLPLQPYRLYGGQGSPYSMKMRAYLRYRHIPHQWTIFSAETRHLLDGFNVIPVLMYPDGSRRNDSTLLIYDLERTGSRKIIPADPAMAFVCHLIEDFADEWLTKAMFRHRWLVSMGTQPLADLPFSHGWVGLQQVWGMGMERSAADSFADGFCRRQISRNALVGVTQPNAVVIDESLSRLVNIIDYNIADDQQMFVCGGSRPTLADFGIFGQASQLVQDPSGSRAIRSQSMRMYNWVWRMDDLSGWPVDEDGNSQAGFHDWKATGELPRATTAILSELVSQYYLPYMLANAAAFGRGDDSLTCIADRFSQPIGSGTRYQVKALTWLHEELVGLINNRDCREEADRLSKTLRQANLLDGLLKPIPPIHSKHQKNPQSAALARQKQEMNLFGQSPAASGKSKM